MKGSKPKARAQKVVKLNTTGEPIIQQLDIDHNDSTLVMSYVSDDKSVKTILRTVSRSDSPVLTDFVIDLRYFFITQVNS